MKLDKYIRKLARDPKWLILYSRAKELSFKLFNNDRDLSIIQLKFLYWLEIYSSLYLDLNLNEPLISEYVIEDDIRVDAYLLYKQKNKHKDNSNIQNKLQEHNIPSVVFTKKVK